MSGFDAIICGAGPAGSTAAYRLARAGMKTLVVDRAELGRDKLCGGLLSGRSDKLYRSIFSRPWDEAIVDRSEGAAFYHHLDYVNSIDDYKTNWFTNRRLFDRMLIEQAIESGAEFRPKTAVIGIDPTGTEVEFAGGEKIKAGCILGADGVNSRIRQKLFGEKFDKEKYGWCLEVELPRDLATREVRNPEIYFALVKWGYGWVFPKGENLTVGVGGIYGLNPNIESDLRRLLKNLCGREIDIRSRGHYIPFGNYLKTPGRGSVLLAGDAVGLVEPITGEGIALAMASGAAAADAFVAAAEAGAPDSAIDHYMKDYSEITYMIDKANMMKQLIFPAPAMFLFIGTLRINKGPIRAHMDLMADDIGYRDYMKYLARLTAAGYAESIRGLFGK